jgi:ABC-type multidrug transport system ATPase subunit
VKTYSSGMMVRLAFAVIAHVDADILIIDEALAVEDAFFTQKCMRFLRNFMKTGTVLFVSHDTSSIKNLCNYAVWLEKGQVLQEGAPKEVCELYLEAFYEAQQGRAAQPSSEHSRDLTIHYHLKISDWSSLTPAICAMICRYLSSTRMRHPLERAGRKFTMFVFWIKMNIRLLGLSAGKKSRCG